MLMHGQVKGYENRRGLPAGNYIVFLLTNKTEARKTTLILCLEFKPDAGFSKAAVGADFTAVGLNQLLDDGQADAGAAGIAGAGRVGREESFKNKRQILLGNAWSAVDKIDSNRLCGRSAGDGDVTTDRSIFPAIFHQVANDLKQFVAVCLYLHLIDKICRDADSLLFEIHPIER